MNTVVCIKVDTKYDAHYVNVLEASVRRHLSKSVDFVCLTDNPKDVNCQTYDIGTTLPGWWSKLVLFKPHEALPERFVFLDLDTVIVDNIDFLFDYAGDFCILKDFWNSTYNSSVIAMRRGYAPLVWTDFNMSTMIGTMHGDQDWITKKVLNADHWQNVAPMRIASYKANGLEQGPGAASLVCFHGYPKPHDFKSGWVHDNWHD